MPRGLLVAQGVSKTFIDLLFGDAQASRKRVVITILILILLGGLATWLWWPWGLAVHAGVAGIGFLIGWLIAGRTGTRYESSLRSQWDRWMQLSEACDTVGELGRKVQRKSSANRAYLLAAALTMLWAIEILLVVVAASPDGGSDVLWNAPVIAANGLLVAMLLGHQAKLASWTRGFANSLAEMVRDGEIGVWGMR